MSTADRTDLREVLAFYAEAGVDAVLGDEPVNRFVAEVAEPRLPQAAADAAQAATSEPHLEEAGVDASEEISMEEVLGPGTHKKPVVNEEAELPKVESQTV